MKIAISAQGPGLDAMVGHRFGTSPYLLVIDTETNDLKPIPIPGVRGGKGSGMQVVALAVGEDVQVVLTGYCSPVAEKYLADSGVMVLTGIQGNVAQVVDDFKSGAFEPLLAENSDTDAETAVFDRHALAHAVKQSARQFMGLLPILSGVILLTGLATAFVSKEIISSVFTGHPAADAFFGAVAGGVFTGNPINSYIIGGELLENGVSLFAVTAFMVSWVTVGVVQLPAEMGSLGKRFALFRNGIAFMVSMLIAIGAPVILNTIL